MARYRDMTVNEDGWTDWVQPSHDGYKFMCCDCGLVHTLEFAVIRDTGEQRITEIEEVPGALVIMRARRNERATAAARR